MMRRRTHILHTSYVNEDTEKQSKTLKKNFTSFPSHSVGFFCVIWSLLIYYLSEVFKACLESFWR